MSDNIEGAGVALSSRLSLPTISDEGHDLTMPCVDCKSSDAGRLHRDTGVYHCYSCKASYSPLQLATKILGDEAAAWKALEDIGLVERRTQGSPASEQNSPEEILRSIARSRNLTIESLVAFGARYAKRGKHDTARLPLYKTKTDCTYYFMGAAGTGKGWFKKGGGTGILLHNFPKPGEEWLIVEGKDAFLWRSLGFNVAGLPGTDFKIECAEFFRGVRVTLLLHRDKAGITGSHKAASRLYGVAESVRIGKLPTEFKPSEGDDARDVYKKKDGEASLRKCVPEAELWTPGSKPDLSLIAIFENITNGEEEEIEGPNGTVKKTNPLLLPDILERVKQRTANQIRRIGNALFVHNPSGLYWIENTASLFGVLHDYGQVEWHEKTGFITKAEFFRATQRAVECFSAIEKLPHEPPINGHYYLSSVSEVGDGKTLDALTRRYEFETTIDRDLFKAAIVTAFWGGAFGARPGFLFTADKGRGVGKSEAAKCVANIAGGSIDFSLSENIERMKNRLLSPEAAMLRAAMLDNVKTLRLSWAELESILTAKCISGHKLHTGETQRPNTLVWLLTLNGASLSTDIAKRFVIIKLVPHRNDASWVRETESFIDNNRAAIIADCIGFLRSPPTKALDNYSRWASWEGDILSRLPDPQEAQRLILERQAEYDVDLDEANAIEDFFFGRLVALDYSPGRESIRIPNKIVADWLSQSLGERITTTKATQRIKQMASEGQLTQLAPDSSHTHGRCHIWTGHEVDTNKGIWNDIGERIERQRIAKLMEDERAKAWAIKDTSMSEQDAA